ncbi:MAG: hypothetical protein Q9227_003447 [Pyrenula ochraceoflavens]
MGEAHDPKLAAKPPKPPISRKDKFTKQRQRPNYNLIHQHALPLRVYPLPTLIPHNPLSVVAIALSYLIQVLVPPSQPMYKGYFSSATGSIHVTDPESIKALWEMGFFGKGSLSRSEPSWAARQKKEEATSEENTDKRREERRQFKLDRAKKEKEAIEQRLREENQIDGINNRPEERSEKESPSTFDNVVHEEPESLEATEGKAGEHAEGYEGFKTTSMRNLPPSPPSSSYSDSPDQQPKPKRTCSDGRVKAVRFSPTIEAREFDLSAPTISPLKSPGLTPEAKIAKAGQRSRTKSQEHLQISQEEAFFLSYGLGVLQVTCDDGSVNLPPTSLLALFRRHSYFPPRSIAAPAEPDDPFLVSYAVYHHFRSLGWVVRSGIKFSVDYLLYYRGPAFAHAEYAVVVLPSFIDPYWSYDESRKQEVEKKSSKSWWWLHCVNRVQSQALKNLILCYVDIPPPVQEPDAPKELDIGGLLSRYKVREVSVKRWTPNRNRD